MRKPHSTASLVLALAVAAHAQQFRYVADAFGAKNYWTEAAGLADIDNDGDLDVLFARGEGWNEPGSKHQNGLFLNLLEKQPLSFEDKSTERLGINESHARDVISGDVDGDGYVDLLFANGFNRAPPYLYINRGEKKPGYFRMESDARGLTEALSSSSADFGDIDNDGDLDLLIADAGPTWNDLPGGLPRLYVNDGKGAFLVAQQQMHTTAKTTPMGTHFVDLDRDFDLDFFGPNKTEKRGLGHWMMTNDGAGEFADAKLELPATTGAVYEADAADLDGDGDEDLFFTSLATVEAGPKNRFPFGEGPMQNMLAESGTLGFAMKTALGQDDDNDVAFLDHDLDGDLDVVIASLGPREKLLRNDGSMTFAIDDTVFPAIADPSLDITVGDLDNDGDGDLITANGLERIGSPQPPCGIYVNDGKKDTRAPVLLALESAPKSAKLGSTIALRVVARDDWVQDGRSDVSVACSFALVNSATAPLPSDASSAAVAFSGGTTWRVAIHVPEARGDASLAHLVAVITLKDRIGNVTTLSPITIAIES